MNLNALSTLKTMTKNRIPSKQMHICLDIDDTITYVPKLFQVLISAVPESKITVVTFRSDPSNAMKTLSDLEIRYDRLIVSSDESCGKGPNETLAQWKARVVNDLKPDWFFEDMPEVVSSIDPDIVVLMPCDELMRDWLKSVC